MFPSFQTDFLRWVFPSALSQAKELWWFTPIETRINILWEPGVCVLSCFSRVWLCDPMDYSPPGFSVHGILQVRILEWVTMPSSRASSRPRDQTDIACVSYIRFFTTSVTWEAPGMGIHNSTSSSTSLLAAPVTTAKWAADCPSPRSPRASRV